MTDNAQTPPETPAATPPVEAPVTAPAITPDIQALLDSRVAGVQSAFEKRLNAELKQRDAIIDQLKTASLSEEERAQLSAKDRDEELESLRTQIWLRDQAQKNPKAAEVYQKILEADSDDAAFALLSDFVSVAPPAPAPEPETQVPDVDPNNPSMQTNSSFVSLPDGRQLTDELATKILTDLGKWPEY